eukprot:evm.model.scf_713.1 EVM.evm.TU.scf_713.1   scf_713:28311-29375(+)
MAMAPPPDFPGMDPRAGLRGPAYGVIPRPVMPAGQFGGMRPVHIPPERRMPEPCLGGADHSSPRELASDPGDAIHPRGGKRFLGNTPRGAEPPMSARGPAPTEREICKYFLRTGTCGYGDKCRYHHPANAGRPALNALGYPMRDGERPCSFYVKHSWCGFGATCKFHHPEPSAWPAPVPVSPPMVPINAMNYAMAAQYGPHQPGGGFYPVQRFPAVHRPPGGMFPGGMIVPSPVMAGMMPWGSGVAQPFFRPPGRAPPNVLPYFAGDSLRGGSNGHAGGTQRQVGKVAGRGGHQGSAYSPEGSASDASTSSLVDSNVMSKGEGGRGFEGPADGYGESGGLEGVEEGEEEGTVVQ